MKIVVLALTGPIVLVLKLAETYCYCFYEKKAAFTDIYHGSFV